MAGYSPGHFSYKPDSSERVEEIDQVGFFLVGKADSEALVVEVDDVAQAGGRTVVEVGGARGEPAQDRALEAADVLALAADHRPARVGDLVDPALERMLVRHVGAGEGEHRQPGNVERRRLLGAGIETGDSGAQV